MLIRGLIGLAVLVTSTTACAVLRAGSGRQPVPLEVPPAPPRTIATPVEEPERDAEVATPDLEPEVDSGARATEPDTVAAPAAAQPSSPSTRSAAEPPEPSREARPGPDPSSRLRLAPTEPQGAIDSGREIREMLNRAAGSLKAVDRRRLAPAPRAQYDTAQRFIQQAEAALRVENLLFARYLAAKAETLARELAARQ